MKKTAAKTEAKARLLAIAQAIVDQATDGFDRSEWLLVEARRALAKATGKEAGR